MPPVEIVGAAVSVRGRACLGALAYLSALGPLESLSRLRRYLALSPPARIMASPGATRWPVLCAVAVGAAGVAFYSYYLYSARRRSAFPPSSSPLVSAVDSPAFLDDDDDDVQAAFEVPFRDLSAALLLQAVDRRSYRYCPHHAWERSGPRSQDAAAFVHACGQSFSSQVKLAFYAFYKQATEGPCTADPPPLYDLVGRAKWWVELCRPSRATTARSGYTVVPQAPSVHRRCLMRPLSTPHGRGFARNHWRELGGLPKKEAMLQYLFLAQQIIQSLQEAREEGRCHGCVWRA